MHTRTVLLAFTALAGFAAAQGPTPDGSCGGALGFTCTTPGFGGCCSGSGYCGDTPVYCGAGCQSGFSANATACKTTNVPSVDGSCGPTSAGAWTCTGGAFDGKCCSKYGWCGSGVVYCSTVGGCQASFGAACTLP